MFLRAHRVGRIGMRDGDGTYVVPINYAYADGCIYGHAAPGKKIELMRSWPQVAFQVDDIKNAATWRSVLVQGAWEELRSSEDTFRARSLLLRMFEGSMLGVTAGHGHRTTLSGAILFRIRAETMSGRAENA